VLIIVIRLVQLLFAVIALVLFLQPAYGNTNYEWTVLQNAKDRNGNPIGDTKVYGYFLGNVFVVCDVETKLPTGQAFLNNGKTKTTTVQIIKDWERQKKEDWSTVKRIDPVQVTVKAPNIVSNLTYDWDHYLETGELVKKAEGGSAQWPGSTGAYLIPGSDPNYWLIVAEITNPNPWPVITSLNVNISRWRSGFSLWQDKTTLNEKIENIYLDANETKFVLINKGKKDVILGDDIDWKSPVSMKAWSEGYYRAFVTENMDPELPDSLKPNRGYIAFDYYGGPPVPRDLSDGIPVSYRVDCRSNDKRNEWSFDGTVYLTGNGWVASGRKDTKPEAKRAIEDFFTKHQDNLPRIDEDDGSKIIDGIKFYRCETTGNSAYISSGPDVTHYDCPGPVLVDYSHGKDYNLNVRTISVNNDYKVGWCDKIPVLKYKPIFIEQYEFEPTDPENNKVGRLVKKTVPGYNVFASFIDRPYFQIQSRMNDYEITEDKNFYNIKLRYHIDITAINSDSDATVEFLPVELVVPNEILANYAIQQMLAETYQTSVSITPDYYNRDSRFSYIELGNITIGPNTQKGVAARDIVAEYKIAKVAYLDPDDLDPYDYFYPPYGSVDPYSGKIKLYISKEKVDNVINYVTDKYFNWTGEAAFGREFDFKLTNTINDGEMILTLNNATAKMRDRDGDYDYFTIGLIDQEKEGKFLRPLSYFNPWGSAEGLNMRASDEVWAMLNNNKKLVSQVTPYKNHENWPFIRYYKKWGFTLLYS
jgi:hypothetical protein